MGRRISYYIPKSESSLAELIGSHFDEFREWYLRTDKQSLEEFNEHLSDESFISILEEHHSFDSIMRSQQAVIDRVVREFVTVYCDFGEGRKLLKSIGPAMSTRRYSASTKLVEKHLDEECGRLWQYLFEGRSIHENEPFIKNEDGYRIGYWKLSEVAHFRNNLYKALGTTEDIRQRFWTKKEKTKHQIALNESAGSAFGVSDHDPSSSGLEFIQQTLNEMEGNLTELIFFTEI